MTSEKSFREYVAEIRELESDMVDYYSELLESIEDEEIRSTIKEIKEDEMKHKKIVDNVDQIISESV
jgi:rubrerythrin